MSKKNIILCFILLLKFVLQYALISTEYDLHRDEYLYLDQANHLAWGYLSVPPVTSWFSYIILLLGKSVFWVRFFPALFGALTILIVWKTTELLGGNLFALILSATAILLSALLRLNLLYQPNSIDVLCWALFYYCLIQFIYSNKDKWLLIAAVVFAFGFLNKYNVLFMAMGLFPALLITKQRKIFAGKHLYYAAGLALLLVLPNLVWQYQNDFPVIYHMQLLTETQLNNSSRTDFIKEQLIYYLGAFYVLIAGIISFFLYQPFHKYRVLFWSYVFTLIIFMYFKAKGYYAMGLHPVYFAFGSVYLEKLLDRKTWVRYLKPVMLLIAIVMFIPLANVAFPVSGPAETEKKAQSFKDFNLLRWEDGKDHSLPQDFADMLGWSELAAKVDSVYAILPDKNAVLVLCDNYGQAGAINYYSKFSDINALSYNADYIHWFDMGRKINDVIIIKDIYDEDRERKDEIPLFDTVMLTGRIENKYAREYDTRIYLLKGAKADIHTIIKEDIEEHDWKNR